MDDFDVMQALEEEIFNSQAYEIYLRLRTLKFAYWIFERNYRELKEFLVHVQKPEIIFQWSASNRQGERNVVLLEITRQLHNFLASIKTLVDHTRKLVEQWYSKHDFYREYQSKKDESFTDNLLHNFVQDLRNYTLHYRLPLSRIKFEVRREETQGFVSNWGIILQKPQLMIWPKWQQKAKQYLDTCSDEINVESLVGEYFELVQEFHNWMHTRLREVHSSDLIWLENMNEKLKAMRQKHKLGSGDTLTDEVEKVLQNRRPSQLEEPFHDNNDYNASLSQMW